MPGRVIPIATALRLQLDDLVGGAEQTVVLQRAVALDGAGEATLRVGVTSVSLESPGVPGFWVEARPVCLGTAPDQDVLGDVVGSVPITEVSSGTLLMAKLESGDVAGVVQIAVRCGQPLTGPLQMSASVDLVLKWSETSAAARRPTARPATGHGLDGLQPAQAGNAQQNRETALRERIVALTKRFGPRRWLERATVRARQAERADASQRACSCCGAERCEEPAGAVATARILPTEISRNLALPELADRRTREAVECSHGVCCTTTNLVVGPDAFGNTYDVLAQVCYPATFESRSGAGLFLLTHGSPDGLVPDDPEEWLVTTGADYLPLQHDLARQGIISFFIVRIGGVEARAEALVAVVGAAKLYILSQASADPTGPLSTVNVNQLPVAFGGHSDGGAAALRAGSVTSGVPVRAVVGLASASGNPTVDPTLYPGTYYLGIVGTHDGSPSVKNVGPVALFEAIVTDKPKLLVVLRGVTHAQLGPGIGSLAWKPGPFMTATTADPVTTMAARSYLVRTFLRWALLGDHEAGRELAVDDVTTIAWGETEAGDSVPAFVGPETTTTLVRFPSAQAPLAPFERHTIFSPGTIGTVTAISPTVYLLAVAAIEAENAAAEMAVVDCDGDAGDTMPAPRPTTGLAGDVIFVGWDLALGGASGAVLRFRADQLAGFAGGFQPVEDFSIVVEVALRANAPANVPVVESTGAVEWYPAIGVGPAEGPTAWIRPGPVLYGFGYPCALRFLDDVVRDEDQRRTVLTTVCVRLPLLLGDYAPASDAHVYLDLAFGAFERGEAIIRDVSLVYHG